ncbi:hypothetical protein ACHHYP_09037 [Achlya hypogyna]|uniref:RRM domain-containing protein n=1 Tax=Achlya hypogyna TaxID=1202772 RepID=A0A1V9ZJQ3_ACHHY|nr:hypothetical protein ACHHYP_09037 [Achlya hypogyna]
MTEPGGAENQAFETNAHHASPSAAGKLLGYAKHRAEHMAAAAPYRNQRDSNRGESGRRVYVGNLAWDVTEENLKNHMRIAGLVDSCNLMTEGSGRSKGCAIVTYRTKKMATNAIEKLSDKELMGRKIFVREDREDGAKQPQSIPAAAPKLDAPSSYQAPVDTYTPTPNAYTPAPTSSYSAAPTSSYTSTPASSYKSAPTSSYTSAPSSSYASVPASSYTPSSYSSAPNSFTSTPNSFTSAPNSFTSAPNSFTSAPTSFSSTPNSFSSAPNSFSSGPFAPPQGMYGAPPSGGPPTTGGSCRVYVGNLSWGVKWQDLKDHMKQAGPVLHASVMEEASGRSKGCGIVEFDSPETAQRAIQMLTDTKLDNRPIFVREDREPRPGHRGAAAGGRPPFGRPSGHSGPHHPPHCTVYIGNLPFDAMWQDIKDLARTAASVDHVEVASGPDGRSKGYAILRCPTPQDAQAAIGLLHGAEFRGRFLEARLDRSRM